MEKLSGVNIIITCEHAGIEVPEKYAGLFEAKQEVLYSHRGWDPGALDMATLLSAKLEASLFKYPYTRLLIEPNRSLGHPKLFSEFSKNLPQQAKDELIKNYYLKYRMMVKNEISKLILTDLPVAHLSIHSFTPVLEGKTRDVDIGILYDPGRNEERHYSGILKRVLKKNMPDIIVKMNQPYKGISDGFTTALRKCFTDDCYLGIELEITQRLMLKNLDDLSELIAFSVKEAFSDR
jgi:predicted N-formylglutamate amidohydrolase